MAVVGAQSDGNSHRNWLKIFQGKGSLLYSCAIPSSPDVSWLSKFLI